MDSNQPPARPPMKKIKVLVKRPVSSPSAAPAPQSKMIKVPVNRPPASAPTGVPQKKIIKRPVPTAAPAAQPAPSSAPRPTASRPPASSQTPKVINGVAVKPLVYDVPEDLLDRIDAREKIPEKLFLFYIYARTLAEQNAERDGYTFPAMMIDLPKDTLEAAKLVEEIDEDIFDAILDDILELAPFIPGMERVIQSRHPLDEIIAAEVRRVQSQDVVSRAQQLVMAYLMVLVDMETIQHKLELHEIKDEENELIEEIQDMEEEEKELKQDFINAIKRKGFPVDAERLINNYFTLAKREPEKAYQTLITNPLFFSPIQMEKLPKRLFGLIKPSANDAIAVNKKLASFLKHLKV